MLSLKQLFRRLDFQAVKSAVTKEYAVLGCGLLQRSCRFETAGVLTHRTGLRIETDGKAHAVIHHLMPEERCRLLKALEDATQKRDEDGNRIADPITRYQARQLFIVNMAPFIGFGILDNAIMIFAGEYIDQSLGAWLAISTMAAAALGNIISDVGGIGLAHYVEFLVSKFGFKHPVLTSGQLESSYARVVVNLARAIGITIGCLIGMFPLLFFDKN